MTPPDFCFCFSMRFLGNWCSTTFKVGENSFVPRAGLTPCRELSPSPRTAPLRLCQARGPIVCAKSLRPTPGNFVSAKPARFHGLKLSQTLLAEHLNRATLSSHPKSTCMSGALQNRCYAEEATNDHGDKVSLTLTHFLCVSYRLVFWFYNNKRGLLSLVFPSLTVILHPKGCL